MALPTQATSSRLLKLPAELRTQIYELVSTTDYQDTEDIDLLSAASPSNNLVLVCRQIYNEAFQLYEASNRTFWSTSNFSFIHAPAEGYAECSSALPKALDLEHVANLRVKSNNHGLTLTLLDKRGGWLFEAGNGSRIFIWNGREADGKWNVRYDLTHSQLQERYSRADKDLSFRRRLLGLALGTDEVNGDAGMSEDEFKA